MNLRIKFRYTTNKSIINVIDALKKLEKYNKRKAYEMKIIFLELQ